MTKPTFGYTDMAYWMEGYDCYAFNRLYRKKEKKSSPSALFGTTLHNMLQSRLAAFYKAPLGTNPHERDEYPTPAAAARCKEVADEAFALLTTEWPVAPFGIEQPAFEQQVTYDYDRFIGRASFDCCYADMMDRDNLAFVDFKTYSGGENYITQKLARSRVHNFNYDLQAAYYMHIVGSAHPTPNPKVHYVICWINSETGSVIVDFLSSSIIKSGFKKLRLALDNIAKHYDGKSQKRRGDPIIGRSLEDPYWKDSEPNNNATDAEILDMLDGGDDE